jgi:hypothetical protein
MKTLLLSLTSVLCTSISLSAQITINRNDFGTVGDMLFYANDTTTSGFSVGAAGANVTWNFSTAASANFYDTALFAEPSAFPNPPEEANIAIAEGGEPSFFHISDSAVKVIVPLDLFAGATNPQILISKFPFTYGGPALKDSSKTKIQGTPEDFGYSGVPFDSMRILFDIHTVSLVDGWGSLVTPAKTYDALRVKNVTDVDITIQGKMPIIGNWIDVPVDGLDQHQEMYGWYAKNGKYTIAEAEIDTLGHVASFRYQVDSVPNIPEPTGLSKLDKHIATSLQPNPVNDVLKLSFNSNYNEKGTLMVFDITGKVVLNQEIAVSKNENEISIKTIDMNNGIYFTRIVSEHINTTSKFVVKH